jgi:glucose/arabinose dehydrogenase
MKAIVAVAAILVLLSPLAAQGKPKITLLPFASGLERPMDIVNAGDERLFVAEREGVIRIIEPDGTVLPTPFLDFQSKVTCCIGEQGFQGLVFHPNYASNGFFYVHYAGLNGNIFISRFTVTGDPNVADPTSEQVLLEIVHPGTNHNGGDLQFGPQDGYLYISVGDSAGANGSVNGQKLDTLLGKVLRIDVDGGSPYAIPADNPFVDGNPNTFDEIWAYGLRNPFHFSFDRLTGDMYLGDVGQDSWEEINFQPASSAGGENYGWRCYEGNHPYDLTGCGPIGDFTFPIHEYPHDPGCSVTGGFVYRGANYPVLQGHYFFSDFCTGEISSLTPDGGGGWELASYGQLAPDLRPTVFGEDASGELYVTAAFLSGTIYRFSAADSFKCYKAKDLKNPQFMPSSVTLEDQFGVNDGMFQVTQPALLCNPSVLQIGSINNLDDHLTCYKIKGPELATENRPTVEVGSPFGIHRLSVKKPAMLCVPSSKSILP